MLNFAFENSKYDTFLLGDISLSTQVVIPFSQKLRCLYLEAYCSSLKGRQQESNRNPNACVSIYQCLFNSWYTHYCVWSSYSHS